MPVFSVRAKPDPPPTDLRRDRVPLARHQLPVHSPITLDALLRAMAGVVRGDDQRPRLAESLAEMFHADHVQLCGSGTDALRRAIVHATSLTRVPAVALPAYGCFDLATAAVGAGVRIHLFDLDPATLSPDMGSFRLALAEGAGAAVVAPLYGMPVDWDELQGIADAAGVPLIEDAAQGQGAWWRGQRIGSLGRISVLSFGRGKGWTGGRGGALLSRSTPLPGTDLDSPPDGSWSCILRCAAQWFVGRPSLYGVPASIPALRLGETVYREPEPGRGMSPAAAALLLRTAALADRAAELRRTWAALYSQQLLPTGIVREMSVAPGATPGYLRFPVRVAGGASGLPGLVQASRLGIAGGYPRALSGLAAVRERLGGSARRWCGALELVDELVTLPTHSLMSRDDAKRAAAALTGGRRSRLVPCRSALAVPPMGHSTCHTPPVR